MLYLYVVMALQILLESLPVSSSGHCALVMRILEKYGFLQHALLSVVQMHTIDDWLHGFTLIVLALFFWSRWTFLLVNMRRVWRQILKIIAFTFIADCMTVLWYIFFSYYPVDTHLMLGIGFLITGLALYALRYMPCQPPYRSFTWPMALILGFIQGIALLPGISRLATTYAAARFLRLSPAKAFEISWLLAVPLFLAAFLRSCYHIAMQPSLYTLLCTSTSLVVLGIATVGAFLLLRLTAQLSYRCRLWYVSLYMIIPFLCWLMIGY